jgi:carbonic anhydrase
LLLLFVGCGGDADTPSGDSANASPDEQTAPHWGYEKDNGPARWGEMSEDWSTCATGQRQSPIDLGNANLGEVSASSMSFPPADLHVVHQEHVLDALDNGHTIQVDYDGGGDPVLRRRDLPATAVPLPLAQ